jgi:hypothetical protein
LLGHAKVDNMDHWIGFSENRSGCKFHVDNDTHRSLPWCRGDLSGSCRA